MSFLELFKLEKDKSEQWMSSPFEKGQQKRELRREGDAESWRWHFRKRKLDFSLSFQQIRLSEVFGARRKATLRGEVYAWTPVLESFVKLRKVGFLPTWVLYFI